MTLAVFLTQRLSPFKHYVGLKLLNSVTSPEYFNGLVFHFNVY